MECSVSVLVVLAPLESYMSLDGGPLFSAWSLNAYVTFLASVLYSGWVRAGPTHLGTKGPWPCLRPVRCWTVPEGSRDAPCACWHSRGVLPTRRRKDPEGWSDTPSGLLGLSSVWLGKSNPSPLFPFFQSHFKRHNSNFIAHGAYRLVWLRNGLQARQTRQRDGP